MKGWLEANMHGKEQITRELVSAGRRMCFGFTLNWTDNLVQDAERVERIYGNPAADRYLDMRKAIAKAEGKP